MSGPTPIIPHGRTDTSGQASPLASAGLDWLDGDDPDESEWTPPSSGSAPTAEVQGDEPVAVSRRDPERVGDEPDDSPTSSGRGRMLLAGVIAIAATLVLGYLALRPDPESHSPALEAEQPAPQTDQPDRPDPTPGPPPVAEPVPPEPAAPVNEEAPEPSEPVETTPVELPPDPPANPAPAAPPAPVSAAPAPEAPRPEPATAEALVRIAQTLETQRAMIERLERGLQIQGDRLAGLEAGAGTAQATGAPLARAKKRTASELPPTTTQPQARLTQRRGRDDAPPLPFYIESVDTWDGEPRIVVRAAGRLIDLKPGDRQGDWRIKAAQGQAVTLLSPDGRERTVTAGGP